MSVTQLTPSAQQIEDSLESVLDQSWDTEVERSSYRGPPKVRAYGEKDEEIVVAVDDSDLTLKFSYRPPEPEFQDELDLGYQSFETELDQEKVANIDNTISESYDKFK